LQVERIQNKTEILKTHIEIGKVVDKIGNPKIREIVEGNYRIIYRIISKNELHILYGPSWSQRFEKKNFRINQSLLIIILLHNPLILRELNTSD